MINSSEIENILFIMLNLVCDQPHFIKLSLFFHYFLMLVLGCTLFPPIYTEIETGILNVALGWVFQFFPIDERDKDLEFSRLGSVW